MKIMEFQILRIKIEAHSVFSIEGISKILREPIGTFGVQLMYKTKGKKNFKILKRN